MVRHVMILIRHLMARDNIDWNARDFISECARDYQLTLYIGLLLLLSRTWLILVEWVYKASSWCIGVFWSLGVGAPSSQTHWHWSIDPHPFMRSMYSNQRSRVHGVWYCTCFTLEGVYYIQECKYRTYRTHVNRTYYGIERLYQPSWPCCPAPHSALERTYSSPSTRRAWR